MSRYILSVQKDIVTKWLELGEQEAAEYSIKAFALCFATHHPREAMNAYLEKRETALLGTRTYLPSAGWPPTTACRRLPASAASLHRAPA